MKIVACAILAALLAGCMPTIEQYADRCSGYGFQPGTPEFLECQHREKLAQEQALNAAVLGLWM